MRRTGNIYNTTLEILNFAKENNITTYQAEFNVAQNRIDAKRNEKR